MAGDPFADEATDESAEATDPWGEPAKPAPRKTAARKTAAKAAAPAPEPDEDPFGVSDAGVDDEDDPFGEPAAGGSFPAIAQLNGRYLVVLPTRLEKNVPGVNPGDKPRDRITANVMVCNGETITVKLDKDGDVVADLDSPVKPGDVLEDFYISGAKLVAELRQALKAGRPVIGKLVKLKARVKGQSGAWSLEPVPAGHPARKAAGKMWLDWEARQAESATDDPFSG